MSRLTKCPGPLLAALELLLLAGCSANSSDIICGGAAAPAELHLSDVTPELGSIVANAEIVHSFSILDDIGFEKLVLTYAPAHTAGDSDPALSFQPGAGTKTYTAAAVTWETAPAHVELDSEAIYQTPDGCAYRLPTPLFSYDLDAP